MPSLTELRAVVERLAAAWDVQTRHLIQLGTPSSADELALEFEDLLPALRDRLSSEAQRRLSDLDRALETMSATPALWDAEMLRTAPEWRHVRSLAMAALEELPVGEPAAPLILFPLVLFHDDGARVYTNERAACLSAEPADVQGEPNFSYGYDLNGNGVRLAVRTVDAPFLWFSIEREVVVLVSDPSLDLDADEDARQSLEAFIERRDGVPAGTASDVPTRQLLARALNA